MLDIITIICYTYYVKELSTNFELTEPIMKILVVDDKDENRKNVQPLVDCGHEVKTATCPVDAMRVLNAARKDNVPFDVVLTDLMMPHYYNKVSVACGSSLALYCLAVGIPVCILTDNSHENEMAMEVATAINESMCYDPDIKYDDRWKAAPVRIVKWDEDRNGPKNWKVCLYRRPGHCGFEDTVVWPKIEK